jgi:hypothetical protein
MMDFSCPALRGVAEKVLGALRDPDLCVVGAVATWRHG